MIPSEQENDRSKYTPVQTHHKKCSSDLLFPLVRYLAYQSHEPFLMSDNVRSDNFAKLGTI